MIYLIHPDTYDTRSCESERTACAAEAQGFERVPRQEYIDYRRVNDEQRLAELLQEEELQEETRQQVERVVGGPNVPPGFKLYTTNTGTGAPHA